MVLGEVMFMIYEFFAGKPSLLFFSYANVNIGLLLLFFFLCQLGYAHTYTVIFACSLRERHQLIC